MENYIGIDDGHYSTKICTAEGVTFSIPSRIVKGQEFCYFDEEKQKAIEYLADDGNIYTVIPENQKNIEGIIDTRRGEYYYSDANKILVTHILNSNGFGDKNLNIVSGLPLESYYKNNRKNDEIISKKIENLINLNAYCSDKSVINPRIIKHNIIAEGVATLYDLMYDFDLNPQIETMNIIDNGSIAIVDIGGRTIDIASVKEGGENLYFNYSGTKEFGALSLIDEVTTLIKYECDVDLSSSIQMVEKIIDKKVYYKAGKEINLQCKIDTVIKNFADKILNEIIPKILSKHKNNVQMIIFTGGGTLLIQDYLNNIDHANIRIVDDPQFSNARGMAKVAKMLERV